MNIKQLEFFYLGHVTFLFRSDKDTILLTDPMFGKGFMWQGHFESYLNPPNFSPNKIRRCDAIFVSHIHGDHYDPESIEGIHRRTKARILAPEEVLKSLDDRGIDEEYLMHIENKIKIDINDIRIIPLSGYDNSIDKSGKPNKFSILIETGKTRVFFSGDCHEIPPDLKGEHLDAIFSWPFPNDETLINFCMNVKFSKFVLMHGGKFKPGDFLCNFDYYKEKERIERLFPNVDVVVPEKISELSL